MVQIRAHPAYFTLELAGIGQHDQRLEHNLLFFFVGVFVALFEGARFLLEDADMLAVPFADELAQVVVGGCGDNITRIGESSREVE